ncbi:MAG TPA: glycoside hydrolase family 48 protein [Bacillota bacterium]|nr:glycoside hydrolase family 48 protein [Bacillota bacterium]
MFKKTKKILGVMLLVVLVVACIGPGLNNGVLSAATPADYQTRFMQLFNDIQTKGYLSPEGIPYYSLETLMVETPMDLGHETTSDTLSYLTSLGAAYGAMTGNWSYYKTAWDLTEKYIIPTAVDQPGWANYDPNNPAPYIPEADLPSNYPVAVSSNSPTGIDPIGKELVTAYAAPVYQMHWLLDVDNWYQYGNHGDGTSRCSYIDSLARGAQESVWETIPHPCWENFNWGSGASGGFLPLYVTYPTLTQKWQYGSEGCADARQIQASFWANYWAAQRGNTAEIAVYNAKAAKLGDFLRYVMFDKYFKPIGIQNGTTVGTGYDSCHYLIGEGLTWGGELDGSKSWRTASSNSHQGYQNPVTAYALANIPELAPKAPNAKVDWTTSLGRQLELLQYLQSAEGAIAGGVTNSWGGRYLPYPAGISTFYKMAYDMDPISHDPPGNMWFGYQTRSMDRLAEYYLLTGNNTAKSVLDKWVTWAMSQTTLNSDRTYSIPNALAWSGLPDPWTGTANANSGLHCSVTGYNDDVGVAASLAKVLITYTAAYQRWTGSRHQAAYTLALELLDRMWLLYDSTGIATPETRPDYIRFFDQVYVPASFSGTTAQGVTLRNGMTFLDLRPGYQMDPNFSKVQAYHNGGSAPVFKYHRFWAQAEIAMANAALYLYFFGPPITPTPTIPVTATPSSTPTPTISVTATPTPTTRITPTSRPSSTPTVIRRATPTRRIRNTPTRRVTPTRRSTPTPTRLITSTPTSIVTPSPSGWNTPTPTRLTTPTPTRPVTPTPTGDGYYGVSYVIQSDWGTGATISLTISNQTSTDVNGWTLRWYDPNIPPTIIVSLWNATYTQDGSWITVHDNGFNALIPKNGGSVNFGFNMNHTGTIVKPTEYYLNGVPCRAL